MYSDIWGVKNGPNQPKWPKMRSSNVTAVFAQYFKVMGETLSVLDSSHVRVSGKPIRDNEKFIILKRRMKTAASFEYHYFVLKKMFLDATLKSSLYQTGYIKYPNM